MAEIGTIAAALQLAELPIKLQRLCSDIIQAPAELSHLVERISVLAPLLDDICTTASSSNVLSPTNDSWKKCYKLLKKSTDSLAQLVTDLETMKQRYRRTHAVRIYLKKNELERIREKLAQAETDMILAQQIYSHATLTQRDSMALQQMHAIAVEQGKQLNDLKTIVALSKSMQQSSGQHVLTRPTDMSNRGSTSSSVRDFIGPSRTYYDIRLPSWILRTGIQVLYHRGNGCAGISLRIRPMLSYDSDLFRAVRDLDWNEVKTLITERKASPFSINPDGWDLLQYAARWGADTEVIKMLVELGLDPTYRASTDNWSALEYLVAYWPNLFNSPDSIRTGESSLMVVLASYSETISMSENNALQLFSNRLSETALQLLLNACTPSYEKLDPVFRAQMAMNVTSFDIDKIHMLLGADMSLTKAFELLASSKSPINHFTLFSHAANSLINHQGRFSEASSFDDKWKKIILAIIEFERQNTRRHRYGCTIWRVIHDVCLAPLEKIHYEEPTDQYDEEFVDWNKKFNEAIRGWITVLHDLGVNLQSYGRAEQLALRGSRLQCFSTLFMEPMRVTHLAFGPCVDDWMIFVVPCDNSECQMARDFWYRVENPELFMIPGAYIEGDNDDDDDDDGSDDEWGPMPVWVTAPVL